MATVGYGYHQIPHFLNSQSWSVHVFTPSFSFSLKLKDLAKVGVGLISGLERAFYVSEEEMKSFEDNEKALVKKFVKAKNCKRFVAEGYQLYILIDTNLQKAFGIQGTTAKQIPA
ncbi:MAG: hypothetical protein ACO2PP_17800 [Thermocrinis sp.]|jgi:hypothetical protein|uniref:hypothetical protein n=1 Tax=Thermocrinis sp. TaxID=2024383 RepID=UPI003BFF8BA0